MRYDTDVDTEMLEFRPRRRQAERPIALGEFPAGPFSFVIKPDGYKWMVVKHHRATGLESEDAYHHCGSYEAALEWIRQNQPQFETA